MSTYTPAQPSTETQDRPRRWATLAGRLRRMVDGARLWAKSGVTEEDEAKREEKQRAAEEAAAKDALDGKDITNDEGEPTGEKTGTYQGPSTVRPKQPGGNR